MRLGDAKAMYEGLLTLARQFDVALVGGDTTRWENPLAIDVSIMANPYPNVQPVTRSGARVGDRLFVTGPLGGSILGHHLDFAPRVHEARRLAEQLRGNLHAMMDISDGLSLDLWRMCQASNVGAVLHEELLSAVISDDAHRLSQSDARPAMEHALTDGEDFELLLSVEDSAPKTDVPLFPIGEVTSAGFSLRRLDGVISPLEPRGFVH
jgi:thiamine-monophosphate kinase